MKFALVLIAVLVAASAVPQPLMIQQEWDSFKSKHIKVYENTEEEAKRMAIFYENLVKIEEHNKLYHQGLSTFKMGVTPFADMTSKEFTAYINKSGITGHPQVRDEKVILSGANAPVSVDWRTKNVLTPVKNQGSCGSCWSFSATGAMEAAYAVAHGKVLSLSEQQLIDCSRQYGNLGCNGGWMDDAFKYVHENYITYEQSYPYTQKDGKCHSAEASPVKVDNCVDLQPHAENIRKAIAQQPVSVAVDAFEWQLYTGGVFDTKYCIPNMINHGVLAVGYDPQSWIIKNSWGSSWGEGGYIRVSNKGSCGVEDYASFPVVA